MIHYLGLFLAYQGAKRTEFHKVDKHHISKASHFKRNQRASFGIKYIGSDSVSTCFKNQLEEDFGSFDFKKPSGCKVGLRIHI